MKNIEIIVVVLMLFFTMASCDREKNSSKKNASQSMLFTSGGRTSEVLVVMADQNWKMSAGDTIRATIGVVPDWTAQAEPEYRLAHISKAQYGSMYTKFRNILIVEFDKSLKKSKVSVQYNVVARPQTIVKIKSPSLSSFLTAYTNTYKQIKSFFHANELSRIADVYKRSQNRVISKRLIEKMAFKMAFPEGFYIATDKADFMWLRRPTSLVEEGVMIYTYPYSDTSDFNYQHIIQLRDSLTRLYIPGPVDDSFMKVSSFFPPYHIKTSFKGNYTTEIRSLWDVKGYAMGGPYMSYTFVDTIANRMIMIDGYIKAPRKAKRDLMLHIEAIFSTFEFVNTPEKNKD
ncbi:MAG: DUF4837 family protein [Bacteroidales bacterium]|nr:DUF4837 family protein [Bacteroidales bacterium]